MKKLAFFVEGLTEQLFVKKLLTEIAGSNNVEITEVKSIGKRGASKIINLNAKSQINKNTKYYILIIDSSSDSKVQSDIIDGYKKLVENKYCKILGLRDVYPKDYSDIPSIKKMIKYGVPTKPIPVDILLAVMEIEAWFLAEHTHFKKVNNILTVKLIKKKFSIDLESDNIEKIKNPASELHNIYSLVGKSYIKKKKYINRTVNSLDYFVMYTDVKDKMPSLNNLINHLDVFFT